MLIWHGNKVKTEIRKGTFEALRDVALATESAAKGLMKAGGRTESGQVAFGAYSIKTGRGLASSAYDPNTGKKGLNKINTYRSKPGEPPRVQTGTLRRSITHELSKAVPVARVGTNVVYGKHLELGTRNMAPRPFMRPAMMMIAPFARRRFGGILKNKGMM